MLEIITNWNTNLLLVILFSVWVVVKIMCLIWDIQTQGQLEVGVAGDFDKVFEKLLSIEDDIKKLNFTGDSDKISDDIENGFYRVLKKLREPEDPYL